MLEASCETIFAFFLTWAFLCNTLTFFLNELGLNSSGKFHQWLSYYRSRYVLLHSNHNFVEKKWLSYIKSRLNSLIECFKYQLERIHSNYFKNVTPSCYMYSLVWIFPSCNFVEIWNLIDRTNPPLRFMHWTRFGNCQRPIFSLGVSHMVCIKTNLWKLGRNILLVIKFEAA